ncbi:hypothetical protein BS333_13770 [Vibrio azureus]|uniref:Uncharacterized protein n=1 Tax=Vibrio azureus NBRC 104587 TaxID=1219077 RepID=U3C7B8_9VIBR|nr:hypothetical protein [Vibrio azureus]AUI87486.1 hypothetical protein BS333_13770 [Vibrio azureus]GAD77274.1 hypothetical protein VAZ01S_069_00220 [Vibrio azureus NBRC 104587]
MIRERWNRTLTLSVISLIPLGAIADNHIYNSCNEILAEGAFNRYQATNNFETRLALKKWLCSETSNENLNLQYDVMNIFSPNHDLENLSTWKRNNCRGTDFNYSGSKSSHLLIQSNNDIILDDWSNCMQKQQAHPLICYAKETVDSVKMVLKVNGNSGIGNINVLEAIGTNMTALTTVPRVLRTGKRTVRYKIDNINQESYFDLNGQADYIDVSCNYTIPKKPIIESNKECDLFRMQVLDSGKISYREYEYLKDTNMVPLFSKENGKYIGGYPCDIYE